MDPLTTAQTNDTGDIGKGLVFLPVICMQNEAGQQFLLCRLQCSGKKQRPEIRRLEIVSQ